MPKAHRLNVVGDFYVEDGCCTLCGIPWTLAPDLFAPHDDGCFVQKQPTTVSELQSVVEVMRHQELYCVRYRGNSRAVLRALSDAGQAEYCDALAKKD